MHPIRKSLMILALAAIVMVSLLAVQPVQAGLRICNTDPIIYLSDGTSVSIDLTINADISEINSIMYVVHIPKKLSVTGIAYIPVELQAIENVQWVADSGANKFWVAILVDSDITDEVVARLDWSDGQTTYTTGATNTPFDATVGRP